MNKQLVISLLVAVVLLTALVYGFSGSKVDDDEAIGKYAYPSARDSLALIDRVEISTSGDTVELVKNEGEWSVANRGGYPAEFSALSDFFDSVKEARFAERKTNKPEKHKLLGLAGLEVAGGETRGVRLLAGDELVGDFLVGHASKQLKGHYVRNSGDDQVWLLDRELVLQDAPRQWLMDIVVDVQEDQVEEIALSSSQGEMIRLSRDNESGNFIPDEIPSGKKLKYDTVANSVARGLVSLTLLDVQLSAEIDMSGGNETLYLCKDGLRFRVTSKSIDERYFIRIDAKQEGSDTQVGAGYAVRLDPWVFEVAKYTYDEFTRSTDDLFEDIEPKQNVDGGNDPGS